MELKEAVLKHYNIGEIINVEEPLSGSGNAFIITTPHLKFIVKCNERHDFVTLYDKVQLELSKQGFLQSRIIKTKLNEIISPTGLVIYEYITGDNYSQLTHIQGQNAIKYIASYNKALKMIPFSENELIDRNYWDLAKSLDYIVNDFLDILNHSSIDKASYDIIVKAIDIIKKSIKELKELPKQLIHADLGADNFIFNLNNVKTIIDFTPEYSHEYYSLCQFAYWNYLYNNKEFNKRDIISILNLYHSESNVDNIRLFKLLLIKACLFRVVGPYLHCYYNNYNYSKLVKRVNILNSVINQ